MIFLDKKNYVTQHLLQVTELSTELTSKMNENIENINLIFILIILIFIYIKLKIANIELCNSFYNNAPATTS